MDSNLSSSKSTLNANVGQHNFTSRPKFRPLRIKALMDLFESDDDESEDKTSDLEDKDLQPLPDDLEEERMFQTHHKNILDSNNKNNSTNTHKNSYTEERNDSKDHPDGTQQPTNLDELSKNSTSIHERVQNTRDNIEERMQNVNSMSGSANYHRLSSNDKPQHVVPVPSHTNECKSQDKLGDVYDKNSQEMVQRCTKTNSTLDIITEHQSQISNTDLKQQHDFHKPIYSDSMVHISQKNDNVPTIYTQQTNKAFESFETGLGTKDKRNQSQSSIFSENSSEQKQSLYPGEHLATETPLKQMSVNSTRPNPCLSHRSLFQTPQNKVQTTLSTSHAHTPATVSSHWSKNHMEQTPLQNKVPSTKSSTQTPTQSIFVSNGTKQETPRYFGMECKSIRRPLADTVVGNQHAPTNSYSGFQSELKPPRFFHGSQLSKVEEISPDNRSEQKEIKSINNGSIQEKDVNEINGKKNMHFKIKSQEETKENEPNMASPVNDEVPTSLKTFQKSNHVVIGSSVNVNIKDLLQLSNKSNTPAVQTEYKELQNHCPTANSTKEVSDDKKPLQRDVLDGQKLNQNVKQVVDKMSEIQCSVPSNIKPKQKKIISVKNKEYLILGTLGQGMSGEVLRVQDLSCGELRAIKCVNLSRMDKDAAQGCLEEISMLHKLQASCVVRMFDYEIKPPMVYVVMEMGDTDLSRLLKSMSQEKQLPLTMILYYWTEMLTAVKHIHDNGVIHSDLKPANFLLVRGRLKLIDFGIASSMNPDATSVVKNCPIGTLNYISPEALMDIGGNGDAFSDVKYKITFKSDVWSLGCILYSLVYGHTPFQHIRSQWAKINAITNPKPNISFPSSAPSSEGRSNTEFSPPPPVLIDVMRKCLQHDPKARPTVTQLLQIQYVPAKPVASAVPPAIPGHILVKIKSALTEDDWRQFIQVLEERRS